MKRTAASPDPAATGMGSTIASGSAESTVMLYTTNCRALSLILAKIRVADTDLTGREKQHMAFILESHQPSAFSEAFPGSSDSSARGADDIPPRSGPSSPSRL